MLITVGCGRESLEGRVFIERLGKKKELELEEKKDEGWLILEGLFY